MKKLIVAAVTALLVLFIADAISQVRVRGYYRKDGTYVAPHVRSSPNRTKADNYSARGNYNPYTGAKGTVDPYAAPRYRSYAPAYRSTTVSPVVAPASTYSSSWWRSQTEVPTAAPPPAAAPTLRPAPRTYRPVRVAAVRSSDGNEYCELAESARQDLEYAARRLLRCAESADLSDDCSSEADRAKRAADDYEYAVSATNGDCLL